MAEQTGSTASLEWRLLLASCAADPGEKNLAREVDWEVLLRLAERHGMASLLYRTAKSWGDAVPSGVQERLRQSYERNVRTSLLLGAELSRILDCLDATGIEAMAYKGLILSEDYYGDMALRQAGDMDLFVRKRDLARVKSAVLELGYILRSPIPAAAEADYIASGYEYAFDSGAGKHLLEVQWALQPRFYAVDFDMEGLFERAMKKTVAGRGVKTLAAEDLLLVLAVHAAKHVWGRLIWLCDIARILQRDQLDWEAVQRRARELGIERILHVTLLLTRRFGLAEIPAAMEETARGDRAAQALAEEIAEGVVSGVSYDPEQVSYFWLMMRLRERRRDRMRFLTRLALTPGPGEWDVVRLPRIFSPLYRVVRMGRLAARLGRW